MLKLTIIQLKLWLEANPEHRRIFDMENEIWHAVDKKTDSIKVDSEWMNLSSRLGLGKNKFNNLTLLSKKTYRIFIAAASIACLTAIGGVSLWIGSNAKYNKIKSASVVCTTNDGEKAHITLSTRRRYL